MKRILSFILIPFFIIHVIMIAMKPFLKKGSLPSAKSKNEAKEGDVDSMLRDTNKKFATAKFVKVIIK